MPAAYAPLPRCGTNDDSTRPGCPGLHSWRGGHGVHNVTHDQQLGERRQLEDAWLLRRTDAVMASTPLIRRWVQRTMAAVGR